ncbi:MAG TPA: helix-turn-helix transcriptional regulator [Tenuifilaceae bacterium]|nr:helix-turn-helix transcriptional regulator [Tenuifilaceae bacterium]
MTENERLKEIRTKLGLTQRMFSESLEIKQGSYSDVERGKAGVSALLLKNLIRKYRVNPLWLCEGEGDMFILNGNNSTNSIQNKGASSSVISDDASIRSLLERQQQYIESVSDILDLLND